MMEIKKSPTALLLGGDHRMTYTADVLAEKGYAVSLLGQEIDASPPKMESAIRGASLVVLPIPVTRDGVHLNAPLAKTPIMLSQIVLALCPGQTVAGGTLSKAIAEAIRAKGCEIYDYQTDENFALHNALATAEGAIAMAISESPSLLAGSRCTVIGFGRIAKQLCRLLSAMGAEVKVLARKSNDRTLAETLGYTAHPIDDGVAVLKQSTLIFNTVPVCLYDFERLGLALDAIVIDLAPVYLDGDLPKVIRAAALPAKYAPAFAGRLIGRCILAYPGKEEGAL
jgi:dipicolinate synthase subunit A